MNVSEKKESDLRTLFHVFLIWETIDEISEQPDPSEAN